MRSDDAPKELFAQAARCGCGYRPGMERAGDNVVSRKRAATAELGALVSIVGGGTPSKGRPEFFVGDIPWVTPKDMKVWTVFDSEDHISQAAVDASPAKLVPAGSVLVVVRSGVLKHTLPVAIAGRPVALNQDMKALICNDQLEPRFLAYFLKSAESRVLTTVRGTTADNIPVDELRALRVPLLSLTEQRRIADILDKADAIRRNRKEAISLTESLLRSAFLDMFGPAASDYARWPVRTIESLAADVPNALRTGPFGSDLRHSEFVDEGVAVLGIDNAVQNSFAWGERRFITKQKYADLRRYTVRPGDVIVTIMGTTGRSAVVPDDIPTAITTKHLATITLDRDKAEPEFVSQALFRHPEVLRQISAANRGAIMSGLNLGLIKELTVHVPPIEQQRRFKLVTQRARAITLKMATSSASDELFNALVARAFSGSLQTSQ